MSKEEILRNQSNANSVGITAYLSEDGYIWKMILKAMQEYSNKNTKLLICYRYLKNQNLMVTINLSS